MSSSDALGAIGWPSPARLQALGWEVVCVEHPQARPARIVEQHRSGYRVAECADDARDAESLPQWQRAGSYRKGEHTPEQRPAVGDWVLVEGAGALKIVALLPRFSAIKRGAAGEHYKQQVIAANIDTVLVVCGLDGDFNARRIERYLVLVAGSGAQAVVVLTKADTPGADAQAAQQALAGIDAPLLVVNAKDAASVAQLAPWLSPGCTAVLVGSSGAGKSTLTNTLLGSERMKTGEVRHSDARGRHTTTHRALIALPAGACLIDTPGMRELKPTGEEVDAIADTFADLQALAEQCRFRDCRHDREPGCAVRAGIEQGAVDGGRVANWRKLGDEVAGAANQLAVRLAQKAQARVQSKALNRRLDDKHGRH